MEEQLAKEPQVAQELAALQRLLSDHPIVQEFQEIQARALQNQGLLELEEALKQAQKEIVQFEHYEKPEAKKAAEQRYASLTNEYEQHPLVVAYRQALLQADELLQYVTTEIQKKMNKAIEEDETNASKN